MRLEGKVAIVTGCARERGIGRAIAMRLASEGADIVAADYCRSMPEYPDAKFGQMAELEGVASEFASWGGAVSRSKSMSLTRPKLRRWPMRR